MGAGRYDVQKFEEGKHRNGHTYHFKSKTGRLDPTKNKQFMYALVLLGAINVTSHYMCFLFLGSAFVRRRFRCAIVSSFSSRNIRTRPWFAHKLTWPDRPKLTHTNHSVHSPSCRHRPRHNNFRSTFEPYNHICLVKDETVSIMTRLCS